MDRSGSGRDAAVAALLAALALGGYVATLAPGLSFGSMDGQELTLAAATLGVAHPTGYPMWTWLAAVFMRVVPIGEVAYRTNLLSAVGAAGSVGVLYLVGRRLGLGPAVAAVAALAFGASTTLWSQAVITEVYAPNACMVAICVWCLLRWAAVAGSERCRRRFVLFAFVYGCSLGTHLSNLGFAPAYALFVLLTDWRIVTRPGTIVAGLAAFLLAAAQFAWLPLRAGVNDLFPNAPPDTWPRFHAYTLGAFSRLRFAFPFAAQPSRIAMYLDLLTDNFGRTGGLLGLIGMCHLLLRDPRAFWLLAGMWSIHVVFFTQLSVLDSEVFFVASHLVFALFVAFGVDAAAKLLARRLEARRAVAVAVVASLALIVPNATVSARVNDRSTDTALADFYTNVFEVLPPRSVLMTPRGMFGSDVAYWRRILGARPDLVLPSERGAPAPTAGAPTFATQAGRPSRKPDWYVPVLLGTRSSLVLHRHAAGPPALASADSLEPGVERVFGHATLLRAEATPTRRKAPARLRLRTWWRLAPDAPAPVVTTRIDDETVESHVVGSGNLARRAREAAPIAPGETVLEDVEVVLPTRVGPGVHRLALGVVELEGMRIHLEWLPLATVTLE